MKGDMIKLGHGSGGNMTRRLIREVMNSRFEMPSMSDSALIGGRMVSTIDAHVVKPIFFPGGDIGRLSVTGTVNDLAVSGAIPLSIFIAYIIEEGFPIKNLERVTESVHQAAREAGVKILGGDTKVVEHGKADGLYLITSGIGMLHDGFESSIRAGDHVIVSGTLGDHAIAVINARENLGLHPAPESDCAPINHLIDIMLQTANIRFMRDPTRGGLATVLNEIAEEFSVGFHLYESAIPIKDSIRAASELLGIDPLYLANEGKVVAIVRGDAEALVSRMRKHPLGTDASIIGTVTNEAGRVYLETMIGSVRQLPMLESDPLPRIC